MELALINVYLQYCILVQHSEIIIPVVEIYLYSVKRESICSAQRQRGLLVDTEINR